jgi:hypothetical protein
MGALSAKEGATTQKGTHDIPLKKYVACLQSGVAHGAKGGIRRLRGRGQPLGHAWWSSKRVYAKTKTSKVKVKVEVGNMAQNQPNLTRPTYNKHRKGQKVFGWTQIHSCINSRHRHRMTLYTFSYVIKLALLDSMASTMWHSQTKQARWFSFRLCGANRSKSTHYRSK